MHSEYNSPEWHFGGRLFTFLGMILLQIRHACP